MTSHEIPQAEGPDPAARRLEILEDAAGFSHTAAVVATTGLRSEVAVPESSLRAAPQRHRRSRGPAVGPDRADDPRLEGIPYEDLYPDVRRLRAPTADEVNTTLRGAALARRALAPDRYDRMVAECEKPDGSTDNPRLQALVRARSEPGA